MENLKKLYDLWNQEFFQGKVQTSLHTYHRRSGRMGFFRFSFNRASININLNQSEPQYQHTLLHEMVHAYLFACNLKHGHTPQFKSLLRTLTFKAFGFIPQGSISHVITVPNHALALKKAITKEVPTIEVPKIQITKENIQKYKIISTGKIGTFIRESIIYGHKHIVLQIEGMMFPFSTDIKNVIPII